ncbi:uncharacterized protein LOC129577426 [Sitodiplosis mosellana]|uniref:uncharacterized protein LOC129577426 n=1 Tax=Sitodiplosis mosellana TaxID=263140 RepID=UPI0024441AA2|nr:uncharacterized protein LOC129577426 [Sitodiplosis mosellana]
MKFFVAVAFLFAAVCATPHDQSELSYPLRDIYTYMQCVPKEADKSTKIHGCNDAWEEYRQDYLDMITDFEECANRPTRYGADACRYKCFTAGERVLDQFYNQLDKNKDMCYKIVPLTILNCQPDSMRFSP